MNIIKRILRENTAGFNRDDRSLSPITGFSCWALGYLDKGYSRIGCLLHPAQNGGTDLRFRVDYGNKCSRESCPESETFSHLDHDSKSFWLHLADGLDSFSYSSKKDNPLFHILKWGTELLELISSAEGYISHSKEHFLETYPFFLPRNSLRPPVYLVKSLIKRDNVHLLRSATFRDRVERFSSRLCSELGRAFVQTDSYFPHKFSSPRVLPFPGSVPTETISHQKEGKGLAEDRPHFEEVQGVLPPVHRLPMDRDFLDFLRLFAKIRRLTMEDALLLKCLTDEKLSRFGKTL